MTWAVAFLGVFGLSALPPRVFHSLLRHREIVTYRSERQAHTARGRISQIKISIQALDQKWSTQRAAGRGQDPGDWLASFLFRRTVFAVVGGALGLAFLPKVEMFGHLFDFMTAAEGIDGIAGLGDLSVAGLVDYGALADQMVSADDRFLADVSGDGDGGMDMTT